MSGQPSSLLGLSFFPLCGLFYICSKLLLVPVNVSVLLELSVLYVRSGWEVLGTAGVSPAQRDFFFMNSHKFRPWS